MSSTRAFGLGLATAAGAVLLAIGVPAAVAEPPATDDQGYVDSTARCALPATAVTFGATKTSRIAICRDTDGDYQYRGVRIRDGARLILPATRNADGAYLAENGPIHYLITSESLVVSENEKVVREEAWVDFRGPGAASSAGTTTSGSKPTTSTSTTPLPPPLPAEVGGTR